MPFPAPRSVRSPSTRLRAALPWVLVCLLGATTAGAQDDKGGGKGEGDDKKEEPAPKAGATKDDYAIDTSGTTSEIKVRGDGTLAIHIKPLGGLKVHPQAPLEVRVIAPAGVKPQKNKLGRKDVTEPESTSPELRCPLRGEAVGTHAIEAEISFFLCSDSWCQRMKDKVAVPVTVVE